VLDIPALHSTTVTFKIYANVHFFTCLLYTTSRVVDYFLHLVSRRISLPCTALCLLCLFARLLWNLKEASIRANLVKIRRYIGVTSEPYFRQSCCSLNTEPQLSCSFQDAITIHPHAIFIPSPTPAPASRISYSQHVTLPLTTATTDRSLDQYIACFMIIIFCISVCVMIGLCESLFLLIFISSTESFLITFFKGKRLKMDLS